MKSTVTFKEYFKKIYEDVTSASALGGSTGFNPQNNSINSSDEVYAPGELRIAKGSKIIQTRGKAIKIKKRRKNKK